MYGNHNNPHYPDPKNIPQIREHIPEIHVTCHVKRVLFRESECWAERKMLQRWRLRVRQIVIGIDFCFRQLALVPRWQRCTQWWHSRKRLRSEEEMKVCFKNICVHQSAKSSVFF